MKTCPPLKDRHFHTFHRSSDLKLLVPLDVRNEKLYITLTDASNNLYYSQIHFNLKMNQRSLFHDHFDRRRQLLRCTDFFFFYRETNFRLLWRLLIYLAFGRPSLAIYQSIFPVTLHVFLHPPEWTTQKTRNFSSKNDL